jgi:hypothetical protein
VSFKSRWYVKKWCETACVVVVIADGIESKGKISKDRCMKAVLDIRLHYLEIDLYTDMRYIRNFKFRSNCSTFCTVLTPAPGQVQSLKSTLAAMPSLTILNHADEFITRNLAGILNVACPLIKKHERWKFEN